MSYLNFSSIIQASKVEKKIQPESIDSETTLNKVFNQFFDVFGDEQRTVNNMMEIRKVCPNFKRTKKQVGIKNKKNSNIGIKITQGEMEL